MVLKVIDDTCFLYGFSVFENEYCESILIDVSMMIIDDIFVEYELI